MARLVQQEPITPLVCHLQPLAAAGVSTVLVAGGVGETLSIADCVIGVENFVLCDWTGRAQELAGPRPKDAPPWLTPGARVPCGPIQLSGKGRVRARDAHSVELGQDVLDLRCVEGVRDAAHARSIGQAVRMMAQAADGARSVAALLDALERCMDSDGPDGLCSRQGIIDGGLVRPTRWEIAAGLSRFRSLEVQK